MIIEKNSALNNEWQLQTHSIETINTIQSFFKCSTLLAKLISNKQINFNEIENFLHPTLKKNWIDTNKIPNINNATKLIIEVIENKKKIGIIGDYDVDGLTSCVIIKELFEKFDIETIIWIPSRKDGYGPNESAIKFFNENKVDLLIMVDCGTSAFEFKKHYENLILVIDHHSANTAIDAVIINPNAHIYHVEIQQEIKEMSAATLSFFIAAHILKIKEHKDYQKTLKSMLDLVALSTICDMMPLNNLNKALVKEGLIQINEQNRLGLSQLINFSNIKLPVTTKDIAFSIGPKLNSTGRIDSPETSLNLLLAKEHNQTEEIIYKIEKTNNYRKDIQNEIFEEAIELAKKSNDKIICLAHENWNAGVVGIISAMIQNEVKKPTIIGNIQDNIVKASARSNSINIGYLIQKAVEEKIISNGGGHKAAAGLSGTLNEWNNFKEWINNLDIEIKKETIKIDAITTIDNVENDYKLLAPFGIGNIAPKILVKNLIIARIIDKKNYYQIYIEENFNKYLFFLNYSQKILIDALKESFEKKKTITAVITLTEKGPYILEDIVLNHHSNDS